MLEKFECLEGFETLSDKELAEVNGGDFWSSLGDALSSIGGSFNNSDPFAGTVMNGAAWNNGGRPPQANYFPEYNPNNYWY